MPDEIDTLTSSQTSSQTMAQGLGNTLGNSASGSHSSSEGIAEPFVHDQSMILTFGRTEIPLLDLDYLGVDALSYIPSDVDSKHLLDNLAQRTVLEIVSTDSSPQTITILTPFEIEGLELEDRVVTIPAGATKFVGPFPANIYNNGPKDIYFDPSVSGTLKFRAYKVL